ncbi:MAG: hypothetical protein ACJ72Z_11065 [Pyrinomonadaceae bacterium]
MNNRFFPYRFGFRILMFVAVTAAALISFSTQACGQSSGEPPPAIKLNSGNEKRDQENSSISEMLTKQQVTRRKKEYDEMLKRGEEALKLSEDLETSYSGKDSFSNQDIQKLQELEKVVSKIRDDLGGDDEDEGKPESRADSSENEAPEGRLSTVKFLRNSTVKLVDELKKSTRFSISVVAIQTSNSVIRLARLLRLKK